MKVKIPQSCWTLGEPHGLYSPWNSLGQNTGVGSLSLLLGIFPTQGSNPSLLHCRQPCSRPLPTHASTGDSWTLTGKSGSVSCGVTAPFSWVLVHKILFVPSQSLFPQSCVSSGGSVVGLMVTSSKGAYAIPTPRAPVPAQSTADLHPSGDSQTQFCLSL